MSQTTTFEIAGPEGRTTLTLVHNWLAGGSFDDEFDATFGGWSTYLAVMQYVLTNKARQPAVNITIFKTLTAKREQVWPLVCDLAGC